MRDGVTLGADIYTPVVGSKGVLLMHGPYGRGLLMTVGFARAFAGQGYTVVFSSSRGTADSGGELDPMRDEANDTHDVVAWLRDQPWYRGRFATLGGSYLGFTEWALLSDPPEDLVASVVTMGPHDFSAHSWGTGTFRFDLLSWSVGIGRPDGDLNWLQSMRTQAAASKRVDAIIGSTPVFAAAEAFFGSVGRRWMLERLLRPDLRDPFWAPMQHADALEKVRTPTLIVAGWQDIFLSQSIHQYRRLRERGVDVALTVGPWTHADIILRGQPVIGPETLDWLDTHLAGVNRLRRRQPVRVRAAGTNDWLELPQWPPADTKALTLYLHPGGRLDETMPAPDAAEASFVFDPAHPTPTRGGNLINGGGYRDDTDYAVRGDVLIYDCEPLRTDVTVLGAPVVSLAHSTERADADTFVRVSDVNPKGRSRNVSEGYRRMTNAADTLLALPLYDTAYIFKAGHRIRLIVAGGSFPQFARNPGTGENPLTATALHPNRHTIRHSAGSSTLRLPVATANVY
jgi:putative CocE/NonD family hydrolase